MNFSRLYRLGVHFLMPEMFMAYTEVSSFKLHGIGYLQIQKKEVQCLKTSGIFVFVLPFVFFRL